MVKQAMVHPYHGILMSNEKRIDLLLHTTYMNLCGIMMNGGKKTISKAI